MKRVLCIAGLIALLAAPVGAQGYIRYHPPQLQTTGGDFIVPSGQLLLPDGTAAAPSLAFSSDTDTGFFLSASAKVAVTISGVTIADITTDRFQMTRATGRILLYDTYIERDAANTLALRNSTNAQTFNVYNTYTDASNYERGSLYWTGNSLYLATQNDGTGSVRDIRIAPSGGDVLITGTLKGNSADSYTLGTSTNAWQHFYLSRSIQGSKTTAYVDETALDVALVAIAASGAAIGQFHYGATSDTSLEATSGIANFSCTNKADTESCTIDIIQESPTDADSTLTCVPTIDADETNAVMFVLTCDEEGGDNAGDVYWRFDLLTTNTITPQ